MVTIYQAPTVKREEDGDQDEVLFDRSDNAKLNELRREINLIVMKNGSSIRGEREVDTRKIRVTVAQES